jgi:hypothetical protein
MGYVHFMITHRAPCERARACERLVKTFTYIWMDSLQICWTHTTHDHTLHGIHTYHVHVSRARARERVCERAWLTVRLCMDGFSSNLRWTYYKSQHVARAVYFSCSPFMLIIQLYMDGFSSLWWAHTTNDHKLHGIYTYHVQAPRASVCVRARVCERACAIKRSLIFERIQSKFGGDIQHIPRVYMSYLMWVWTHVLTALISIHSRICQACDGQWLVTLKYADACMM